MRRLKKWIVILVIGNIFAFGAKAFADGDKLIVSLGLEEEYNDNIFFDYTDEIDDYITTLSPGIEFERENERTSASLKGLFNILMYSDNSELDDVDQLYTAKVSHKLTERLSLSGNGLYTRDSRSDRDVEETGLVLGTDIRKKHRYGAGVGYVVSEKSNVGLNYNYNREYFNQNDSDNTDYHSHDVNLLLRYDLSYWFPLTTGRINTGYRRYYYPDSK